MIGRQNYDQITVSALRTEANIPRKSFNRHFAAKDITNVTSLVLESTEYIFYNENKFGCP